MTPTRLYKKIYKPKPYVYKRDLYMPKAIAKVPPPFMGLTPSQRASALEELNRARAMAKALEINQQMKERKK